MNDSEGKEKINSNNKDILNEITKELNQINEYIQINLMNIKNKEIDFDEKKIKNEKKIKLGVKRKRLRKVIENEVDKDKNEINLNENEDNEEIILKNKKLKAKIKKFKRNTNEIV